MLRSLHITDAQKLHHINLTQLGYDFPLESTTQQLEKLLVNLHHYFLGYVNPETDELMGYVHAEVYESTYALPLFNVLALAVDANSTGKGLGKTLMQGLEKEAEIRGLAGIRLNSGEARTEAHNFYAAIGYTNDKTQKRFLKLL